MVMVAMVRKGKRGLNIDWLAVGTVEETKLFEIILSPTFSNIPEKHSDLIEPARKGVV